MDNTVIHPFEPIWNSNSKILILGSIPSPKSRENNFYYAHPRNRFWPVMQNLFDVKLESASEKEEFLLNNRIALWDVLKSCEIDGAADGSIKNPKPNDIKSIVSASSIDAVFTTGSAAYKFYRQFIENDISIKAVPLPSTSPANARMSLEMLIESYRVILTALGL